MQLTFNVITTCLDFRYRASFDSFVLIMNFNELTDMLQVYFECNKNSNQALRLYRERFPERDIPNRRKFSRLEENLRKFGSFKKPMVTNRQFEENTELGVLLSVEENARTSIREIADSVGTSLHTAWSVLKKHKFKPYIAQKVQALGENDPIRRREFCNFYLRTLQQDPLFYRKIIWTDECTFTNNGIFNRNIHRYWSQENPRFVIENHFQHRFSVNVWCGLLGDRLIGPFFIDGTLNQVKYHQLLTEDFESFLDELPLATLRDTHFQQDGATPHNARINVDWLNRNFNERWIGTYGPIRWPARSPDLTPLDFWLWGYLQDRVYLQMPETIDVLKNKIRTACREIPDYLVLNATYGVIRRCRLCVEHDGRQFESYL